MTCHYKQASKGDEQRGHLALEKDNFTLDFFVLRVNIESFVEGLLSVPPFIKS